MARLEASGIEVRFGRVAALDGVDIAVPAGQVTGVLGAGGAGKTTLFNVVTGVQRPQAGHILLDDKDITGLAPHRRAKLGIARTFERLEVFGNLTVRENILVAAEIRRRWSRDGANSIKVAEEVMAEVGLRSLSRERCDSLPIGLLRLVELARALATRPEVLLLDEPSAGLDERETDHLAVLLGQLAARHMAVLLFEADHRLTAAACGQIYLLGGGSMVASGTPDELGAAGLLGVASSTTAAGSHDTSTGSYRAPQAALV